MELSFESVLSKHYKTLVTSHKDLEDEISKLTEKRQRMNAELIASKKLLETINRSVDSNKSDESDESVDSNKSDESLTVQEKKQIYEKMYKLECKSNKSLMTKIERIEKLPEWKKLSNSDIFSYYSWKKKLVTNSHSLTRSEKHEIYEKMYKLDTDYLNKNPTIKFITSNTRLELLPDWEKLSKSDIIMYYAWRKTKNQSNSSPKPQPNTSKLGLLLNAATMSS